MNIVKPGHVIGCLNQCSPCLVGCPGHPGCEVIQGLKFRLMNGFKSKLWILASIEHERGGLSQSMDLVVIGEFGNQNPVVPVILSLVHKEAEELLDLLVDMVSLAIHLQVVGHGGYDFNSKYLAKTPHEV